MSARAFDHGRRLERFQSLLAEESFDAAILSVGPDLPYLIGYEAMPSERMTALVVLPEDEPMLLVPALEAPRVQPGPFRLVPWGETDAPISMVANAISGSSRIAVGDHMRAAFLMSLQAQMPRARWSAASTLTSRLRIRKEPEEVAALGDAAAAVDRVLARIPTEIRFSGKSELEVARDITEMVLSEGHDRALWWIVASGPNGASPHHEPGRRVIQEGDLVVCDFGGSMSGYHSDVTRTAIVGRPNPLQAEIHAIVDAAAAAARSAVRPGVGAETVDEAARLVIEEAGYGEYFIHRTGHGIGMEVHESPYIVAGNPQVLESGMAFSIEPGIYLPGEMGVRIEDIVVCVEDGVRVLNQADRGLLTVS